MLDNRKVAFKSDLIERGNWKQVFKKNRKCYHYDDSHPELLHSFVENLSVADVGGEEAPELAVHWARCERAGMRAR